MAKIAVLVGTTLGNAEYISDELISLIEQKNHQTEQHLQPNLDDIDADNLWLLVCSTHGAGDLPDNIQPLFEQIQAQKPDLSKINFAVCAIGDSSYDTFCQGPEALIALIQQQGATPFVDKIQIDIQQYSMPEDPAVEWLKQWIEKI
ncbi:MAG: FMN-binding protein MioC [Shewanella sp.]|nr:FMN-binding protein MioC [Shewanella sp.]